ncbi:MAG: hypothetical protein Q9160_000544 [Pyrenula sp. 1 TL-2023]
MTLNFKAPGILAQVGFGVNEIASAMTIANYTGAFFSRKDAARVFEPLTTLYDVQLKEIPLWLQSVRFDRSGTILGPNRMKVPLENKMPGLQIDSVEGIASFMALITRYVEGVEAVVDYVQDLLRGDYYIVSGGVLENPGQSHAKMPFSLRDHLCKFVNNVADADADSAQRQECVQLLHQLIQKVGGCRFLKKVTEHARFDNQKLLRQMLGKKTYIVGRPKDHFNTLSAGSATIALAAQANGANIRVFCMTDQGNLEIGGKSVTPRRSNPFIVTLWLIDPPSKLTHELGSLPLQESSKDVPNVMNAAYAGMAEISALVARQLDCNLAPADSLEIWRRAVACGVGAKWVVNPNSTRRLTLKLNDDSLVGDVTSQAGDLARRQVRGSIRDSKHELARKCASILHGFFRYKEYEDPKYDMILDFTTIAYSVGCLQRLVSNNSPLLSAYAWSIDCSVPGPNPALQMQNDARVFAEQMVGEGVGLTRIIWQAASIWGGGNLASNVVAVQDRIIGIVCPNVSVILDILIDPAYIAQHGIEKGIMSLNTGSPVTLPRDPTSGLVLAGEPMTDHTRRVLRKGGRNVIPETEAKLLFSIEPFSHMHGGLSAIICAWESGEVALRLNPATLLHNLLAKRTLQNWQSWSEKPSNSDELLPIHRSELLNLEDFSIEGGTGVVRAQGRFDWQLAAAGCVYKNEVIMLVHDEEVEGLRTARDENLTHIGPRNILIILCGGDMDFPEHQPRSEYRLNGEVFEPPSAGTPWFGSI